MRKPCLILLVAIAAVSLSLGCGGNGEIKAGLGQEFSLAIGQSAAIEGEELEIEFSEVVADSRCAKGITCVWEGEVTCMVEITYRESVHRVALTEPGLGNWPAEKPFQEHRMTYHVEPYPEVGTDIAEDEYRLHLTVSKQ